MKRMKRKFKKAVAGAMAVASLAAVGAGTGVMELPGFSTAITADAASYAPAKPGHVYIYDGTHTITCDEVRNASGYEFQVQFGPCIDGFACYNGRVTQTYKRVSNYVYVGNSSYLAAPDFIGRSFEIVNARVRAYRDVNGRRYYSSWTDWSMTRHSDVVWR